MIEALLGVVLIIVMAGFVVGGAVIIQAVGRLVSGEVASISSWLVVGAYIALYVLTYDMLGVARAPNPWRKRCQEPIA